MRYCARYFVPLEISNGLTEYPYDSTTDSDIVRLKVRQDRAETVQNAINIISYPSESHPARTILNSAPASCPSQLARGSTRP